MRIYIRSMSEPRSRIYDKLSNASDQIVLHLVKLLLFPDTDYASHWKTEIYSFLYRIDKLKGKNKWPDYKFVYDALTCHSDTLENYIIAAQDQEYDLTPSLIPANLVERAVDEYLSWLAEELSSKGIARRTDIWSKLDEIMKKYRI